MLFSWIGMTTGRLEEVEATTSMSYVAGFRRRAKRLRTTPTRPDDMAAAFGFDCWQSRYHQPTCKQGGRVNTRLSKQSTIHTLCSLAQFLPAAPSWSRSAVLNFMPLLPPNTSSSESLPDDENLSRNPSRSGPTAKSSYSNRRRLRSSLRSTTKAYRFGLRVSSRRNGSRPSQWSPVWTASPHRSTRWHSFRHLSDCRTHFGSRSSCGRS